MKISFKKKKKSLYIIPYGKTLMTLKAFSDLTCSFLGWGQSYVKYTIYFHEEHKSSLSTRTNLIPSHYHVSFQYHVEMGGKSIFEIAIAICFRFSMISTFYQSAAWVCKLFRGYSQLHNRLCENHTIFKTFSPKGGCSSLQEIKYTLKITSIFLGPREYCSSTLFQVQLATYAMCLHWIITDFN